MTRYWFKPKRYGYGATPVTWEGWTITFAAVIVVAGSIGAMNVLVGRSNLAVWLAWVVLILLATLWFVQFCRRRTNGEWRWRWGNRSDATGI
jgi:hypothetical protein